MFPKCQTQKVPPITLVCNRNKKSSGDEPVVCIEFGSDSSGDSDDETYPIQPFIPLNEQEKSWPGPSMPP